MSSSAKSPSSASETVSESASLSAPQRLDATTAPQPSTQLTVQGETQNKIFQGPKYKIATEVKTKLSTGDSLNAPRPRRVRRRRLSRRSLLFAKLRSLTAKIWSRFPLFHQDLPPALPSSTTAQTEEKANADSSAKIFPSWPKKRKGRPEGTKGAGSRSI